MKLKKSRKLMIIICAAALVLGAAAFIVILNIPRENKYSLSSDRAFALTNTDEVVETIRSGLKGRARSITISVELEGEYMDDISPFVNELMTMAQEHTGVPDEGDYLRYQMGGYTFSYGHEADGNGFRYDIVIVPEYYTLLKEETEVSEEVESVIQQLGLARDASDYDKVLAVYDYLSDFVQYDFVHKNNEYYHKKSTAYGALVNKRACCQGYSVTMYRLLLELGVDCRVITGDGSSEDGTEKHSWNIVCIDGQYYNIDPTWNRNLVEQDYFLKSEADFEYHVRADEFAGEEFTEMYNMAEESWSVGDKG